MKITVDESMFIDEMSACPMARHFIMSGMVKLFKHITDYEDYCGKDWELDTVELAKRYEQVACGLDEPEKDDDPDLICTWMDRGLWYQLRYREAN